MNKDFAALLTPELIESSWENFNRQYPTLGRFSWGSMMRDKLFVLGEKDE